MKLFLKRLTGYGGKKTKTARRFRRTTVLDLEQLETRITPIVGSTVVPAPVMPGGPYDGVTLLNPLVGGAVAGRGSGSLIAPGDGHYILTVAHNDPTSTAANPVAGVPIGQTKAAQATFNLQRNGTPVNIVIPVPANPATATTAATQFVINNPGYRPAGNNPFNSTGDIALWKLVDPVNQQPNRLLVAPFGAQQYQLYTATNEVSNPQTQVTIVGYGRTGVGATGDQGAASGGTKRMGQNAIDTLGSTLRSQVALIQFAGPGTFRVRWRGALQTTPALTAASTPAAVLAALNSIVFGDGNPLAGNVTVQAAPAVPGSWWVTFTGALGGQRIPAGWLQATGAAAVATVIQGGNATQLPGRNDDKLIADFDNGLPQNDAMGLLYGINNLGAAATNEVQRVTITGAPTGGTFQLVFQQTAALNPLPAPLVTGPIAWNAPANGPGSVNAALQALAPLAGNVRVDGGPGPGTPYTITFINGLAGADVNQLSVRNGALTGGINPIAAVTTITQGAGEAGTAAGDSGGPIFIGNRIAGVVQGGGNPAVAGQGRPPLAGASPTGFGETEVWGRVSSYAGAGGFITTSVAATGPYNLVLDMLDQVAGVARNAAGNWDDLTITASRGGPNNANLVLTVNDATDRSLSGVYFSGLAANINGLTLRGAAGNETFVIQGNLGIANIVVDGRGGDNKLQVDDSTTTTNSIRYAVSDTAVAASMIGSGTTLWTVNYVGINAGLEVDGSQAYNQFAVSATTGGTTTLKTGIGPNDTTVLTTGGPLIVVGQGGIDTVALGNPTSGAQELRGPVSVSNTRGLTSLSINDAADPAARNAVVLTPTSLTGLTPFPINWVERDLNNLGLTAGAFGNTFTVTGTPFGAITRLFTGTGSDSVSVSATANRLEIHGQNGRDQVNLGNANSGVQAIRGPVLVDNDKNYTALTIDDSADTTARNATLGPTMLTGLAPGDISWVETGLNSLIINGATVNAGAVGNTWTIFNTPRLNVVPHTTVINTGAGTVGDTVGIRGTTKSEVVINGQNGNDIVTVGSAGSVQQINGPLTITNANGRTALTIDDSADAVARPNVTLNATSLTGLEPLVFELIPIAINWVERDLRTLTIKGGTGSNTFTVANTPRNDFPVTTTLFTGGGNDLVNVQAANGPLTINGQAGDDRIKFFNFLQSATVDGGPGTDTIEVAQGRLCTSQVPFTNVEAVEVTGGSTLAINTDIATGVIRAINGTIELAGGTPDVTDRVDIQAQGILTGTGQINGSVTNAGQVRPAGDGAVGRITVRDDYTQTNAGRLNIDLQGPMPGVQSDNLEVGHDVQLDGTLNLTPLAGFNGDRFTLVSNRGPNAVNGIFAGLAQGAAVMVGGRQFFISYLGNDGNDVVLGPASRINRPPVANNDSYAATENTPLNIPAAGVLANDTDPDGDPLTAVFASGPVHGSLTLNPDGSFTYLPATNFFGSDSFTYQASDGLALSNVATVNLSVAPVPVGTTTSVSASPNPSVYGQPISFTATVAGVVSGYGVPSGMVQFQLDGANFGAPVMLSAGQATSASLATLGVGPHTITAQYLGDTQFSTSTGTSTATIYQAGTTTTVSADQPYSVFGQTVTFTATVVPATSGAAIPTGMVAFRSQSPDGTIVVTLGTAPLDASGTAVFSKNNLVPAAHTIFAVYLGDTNFQGSTSALITQTVAKADTALSLSATSTTVVAGQSITFTGSLSVIPPGAPVAPATGTITLYDTFNGVTSVLSVITIGGSGQFPALTDVGAHTITAVYSGDDDYNGCMSNPFTLTVVPPS
jgi:hypothetical protein